MYSNFEMDGMRSTLQPLLDMRNVCGYAAARNYRVLSDELTEYDQRKAEVFAEMGEREVVDGKETGRLYIPAERTGEYLERMRAYGEVRHSPQLMHINWDDAVGVLSGTEMLAVQWMLEE